MNELDILKARVDKLEHFIEAMNFSDRYVFQRDIQMLDGRNIQLARGTGTQIGTAPDQKLGFFGGTPIVQPSTTGTTLDMTVVGGTTVTESNGFGGGLGGNYYTIGDIVKHLKNLKLLA